MRPFGTVLTALVLVACARGAPDASSPAAAGSSQGAEKERVATTRERLSAIRLAATEWRSHAPACPSVAQLKADQALEPFAHEMDAWGKGIVVECDPRMTRVRSFGSDGRADTADDLIDTEKAPPILPREKVTVVGDTPVDSSDAPPAKEPDVMAHARARFRACFQARLAVDPDFSGKVDWDVQLVVAPSGEVKRVQVKRADPRMKPILPCLVRVLESLTFPPTGQKGDRVVDFPSRK